MNRVEVLEQLEPLAHIQVRPVQHAPRTRVIVRPDMVMIRPGSGGKLVPLNEQGVKAMANFVGMPQTICRQLSPDTFGRVATELLSRKERYNLLMDNGEVGNFAEYRGVRTLSIERVITTIEKAIPKADFHRVVMLENYSTMIEIAGEKRQPIARGDMVRAGALVTFSPIGTIAPFVQSYVQRLACTNGQVTNDILREFRPAGGGGEGDDIWQWFRQSIQQSYGSLDRIITRYREMVNERIPANARAMMLEALLKDAKITGDDADAIRSLAIQDPPRNSYELLNLMTFASSHIIREPARIRRVQQISASFTSQREHAQLCPICHRVS